MLPIVGHKVQGVSAKVFAVWTLAHMEAAFQSLKMHIFLNGGSKVNKFNNTRVSFWHLQPICFPESMTP